MRRSKAEALHPKFKIRQAVNNLARYASDVAGVLRLSGGDPPLEYLPQSVVQDSHHVYHQMYDFKFADMVNLTDTWEELSAGAGTPLQRFQRTSPEYAHARVVVGPTSGSYLTYRERFPGIHLRPPAGVTQVIDNVWVEFSIMLDNVDKTEIFFGFAEQHASHPAWSGSAFGGIGGSLFATDASIGWRLNGDGGQWLPYAHNTDQSPNVGVVLASMTAAQIAASQPAANTWVNLQMRYFYATSGAAAEFFINGTSVGIMQGFDDHILNNDLYLSFGLRCTEARYSRLYLRHVKYIIPRGGPGPL